jgi:hypothetical protein
LPPAERAAKMKAAQAEIDLVAKLEAEQPPK